MYLKTLHLAGFKTFADPTTLEFGPGVTGIVGPNGSGKSNLADAILWVLGEQSMKAIRSPQLVDVIFNGGGDRRPLGMAEVTLTLDNSDQALALDFSEVGITRRTFRSGESEYAINKTPCRLRDIQELFLDTGLGKGTYAIITQNEVDRILSVRGEERRAIFEEAAGTAKYRSRRTEALRKLEATQLNLTRINDILREVESQIEPLREQAEIAREYREISTRLRDLILAHLVSEHRRRSQLIEQLGRDIESLRTELEALSRTLASAQSEEEAARARLVQVDAELETERGKYADLRSRVVQREGQVSLAQERHQLLSRRLAVLEGEAAELGERFGKGRSARVESEQAREALTRALERLEAQLAEKEAERQALSAELDAAAAASSLERDRSLASVRERAVAEQIRAAAEEAGTEAQRRVESLSEALQTRRQDREALAAAQAGTREAFAGADAALEDAGREAVQSQRRYEELLEESEKLRQRQSELAQEIAQLRGRLQFLAQMGEADGLARGARFLLDKRRAGELPAICGTVSDILGVSAEYEAAIHMALGPRLHYVVIETETEARQALDAVKEHGNCRVVLLPLDLIQAAPTSSFLESTAQMKGIRGLASSLVVYNQRFDSLVRHLLGRVLVAEDRAAALSALQAAQHQGAVVTLDGDLFLPSGEIGGGAVEDDNPFRRQREMEEIEGRLQRLVPEHDGCAQRLAHLKTEIPRAGLLAREWDAVYRDRIQERNGMEVDLAAQTARLEALETTIGAIELQLEQARARHDACRTKMSEAASRLESLTGTALPAPHGQAEDLGHLSERFQRAAAETSELRSDQAAKRERLAGIDRQMETWQVEEPPLLQRKEAGAQELRELKGEAARLTEEASSGLQQLTDDRGLLEESEGRLAELQAGREAAVARLEEAHAAYLQTRGAVPGIQEKLGACEIKQAQSQVQLQHIEERLAEEYNLTVEEAAERSGPSPAFEIQGEPADAPKASEQDVRKLQARLRAMGEVNIGAIAEYDRLSQRRDFLAEQRGDLEGARSRLLEIIAEIDEATKHQFLQTFEAVAQHFQNTFSRLFDGGTARVYLTDPERVLESGVEIEVEVPGKVRQNLLALSGGERTLTAVALLFSLLRAKPTPFCLLDEIDAALDEANLYRFGDLLRDFRDQVQFLVVTHARLTMEACDRLYGITMQDHGVSRCLSLELAQAVAVVDETPPGSVSRDFLRPATKRGE